jgi:hypothetical protein
MPFVDAARARRLLDEYDASAPSGRLRDVERVLLSLASLAVLLAPGR